MSIKIKGIAKYIDIGPGFWGIVGDDGKKYLPMPMPEQLKLEGHEVECEAVESDAMTMHMWGEPVEIKSFVTLNPGE